MDPGKDIAGLIGTILVDFKYLARSFMIFHCKDLRVLSNFC